MAFPNTIVGKYGWEKKETSAQKLPLGTEMILRDGRRYRWSRRYLHAGPGKPGITF